MGILKLLVITVLVLLLPTATWSMLPLITDDTGTQGTGKFQFEASGEYDQDRESFGGLSVRETDYTLTPILTYGITDHADIMIGLPYQWVIVKTGDVTTTDVSGKSDTVFGALWRFFEKEGTSVAVKPLVSVPTGNDKKGLGSGKMDYGAFFIASRVFDPWAVHLNFGYVRNENDIGERKDIWHASLATLYKVTKKLAVCADTGIETNRDKTSEVEPAYMLGGAIYSVLENLDISFGVKAGLNKPETDWSLRPGVTYRF